MTDTTQDDLVKLGRAVERDLNNGFPMTCERGVIIQQMANRIEALEAERDALADLLKQRDYRIEELVSMYDALAEKLEMAVGQMQRVKDFRYDPNIGIELNRLEATLAAIKETPHD